MNDQKTVTDAKAEPKLAWETPSLEEVSERVMAQPYIRFTLWTGGGRPWATTAPLSFLPGS